MPSKKIPGGNMKTQDIELLCLLISSNVYHNASQQDIAFKLKRSPSTVNASIRKLKNSGLIITHLRDIKYWPYLDDCIKFLPSVKFYFPNNPDIIDLAEATLPIVIALRNAQF